MSRHPEVKWAQREDKVYLTVMLPDAKTPKVSLEPEGVFTFSASAGGENHTYELKLELNDKVNVEESKINVGLRNIFCVLEKAEKKWWSRLLRAEGKPPHYVKVDWDKWADEDESNDPPADLDMGGMDFSKFGDMGGLGGMGGMGGMGGLGGMGGMGGLGGMGGMGGLGGMDMSALGGMGMGGLGGMDMGNGAMDDFDDSDDEEQEGTGPASEKVAEVSEKPTVDDKSAEGKAEASASS